MVAKLCNVVVGGIVAGVPGGGGVVVAGWSLCYYTSANQKELRTKELGRTRPKGSDISWSR